MFRASLAGAALALMASTALADPIVIGGNFEFVTSSSATEAPGTTTPPPSGGLGHVGGLCNPGDSGCPTIGNPAGFQIGDVISVHPTPSTTAWVIPIPIPNPGPGANFRLSFEVADDTFATFTSGPAPSVGDIFEVTLNGKSRGTTSTVTLGDAGGAPSSGSFSAILRGGTTAEIGITDLLEPFANGTHDTLPGFDDGAVLAAAYDANIVDLFPISLTPAPEPASLALFGGGLAMLGLLGARRRS